MDGCRNVLFEIIFMILPYFTITLERKEVANIVPFSLCVSRVRGGGDQSFMLAYKTNSSFLPKVNKENSVKRGLFGTEAIHQLVCVILLFFLIFQCVSSTLNYSTLSPSPHHK